LTKIVENGEEYLWLTDQESREVAKVTLDGETVQSIGQPPHKAYEEGGEYIPTWAAQNPENGEVWVANGYGCSLVHRFSREGEYLATIDGSEGAGRFLRPHGINFRRGGDLQTATVISNLKYMMDNQHIGDNHNAPVFHWCYKRMGEFVPQLAQEGKQPRVMLDYSGCLLHGLRAMGLNDVFDHLKKITLDPAYQRNAEWLGTAWANPMALKLWRG
jgi:hypothetical protein